MLIATCFLHFIIGHLVLNLSLTIFVFHIYDLYRRKLTQLVICKVVAILYCFYH
jgi:hypothetical protein